MKRLIVVILITFAASVTAEENAAPEKSGQQEYLTPDKMTMEDREMLMEHSHNYNNCLTATSIEQMQLQTDPRYVVDFAMKHCAVELEKLNTKMVERNFDPSFRQSYLHRVSTRGANQTLRGVMMGIANSRPSAGADTSPGSQKQ